MFDGKDYITFLRQLWQAVLASEQELQLLAGLLHNAHARKMVEQAIQNKQKHLRLLEEMLKTIE